MSSVAERKNKTEFSIDEFLDAFAETSFPDLFQLLGADLTAELIAIFGGRHIYIPSMNDLRILVRNMKIYNVMTECTSNQYEHKKRELSMTFRISVEDIEEIYRLEKRRRKLRFDKIYVEPYFIAEEFKPKIKEIRESIVFDPKKHRKYKRI